MRSPRNLIRILADLTSRKQAMEDQQREVEASVTVSPSTSHPITRARCQLSPTQEPDMTEEVRRRVAKRMRQLPVLTGATTDEDTTSDKEPRHYSTDDP